MLPAFVVVYGVLRRMPLRNLALVLVAMAAAAAGLERVLAAGAPGVVLAQRDPPDRGAAGLVRPEPHRRKVVSKIKAYALLAAHGAAEYRRRVPVLAGPAGGLRARRADPARSPEAPWFVAVAVAGFAPALFMLSTWPHIPRWYAYGFPAVYILAAAAAVRIARWLVRATSGSQHEPLVGVAVRRRAAGDRAGQPGRAGRDAADGAAAVPADPLVVPVVALAHRRSDRDTATARPRTRLDAAAAGSSSSDSAAIAARRRRRWRSLGGGDGDAAVGRRLACRRSAQHARDGVSDHPRRGGAVRPRGAAGAQRARVRRPRGLLSDRPGLSTAQVPVTASRPTQPTLVLLRRAVFPSASANPPFGLAGDVNGTSLVWDCAFRRGCSTWRCRCRLAALLGQGPATCACT